MTWRPERDAPEGVWLRTRRRGEAGMNICALRIIDGDREWIEHHTKGGRTTVTHHSFAPPTHWRPLHHAELQQLFPSVSLWACMRIGPLMNRSPNWTYDTPFLLWQFLIHIMAGATLALMLAPWALRWLS